MVAVKAIELTKKYKKQTAVDSLSLEIYEGELFSLLGVNGAGKTTTVKMLSALLNITSGEAYIFGKSIVDECQGVKELIAISPQETSVGAKLTVFENLVFIARLHGKNPAEAKASAKRISERLKLDSVCERPAGKLSGGYQRRLSIAMALICEPRVLFLDEPTLGLDVLARRELWEYIEALKGDLTVILTTHYMEEAETLSDRVGIMKDGKLLFVGTAEEIKKKTGKEHFEDAFVEIVKEHKSEN